MPLTPTQSSPRKYQEVEAVDLEEQARQLLRHKPGSVDALFLTRGIRALERLTVDLTESKLSTVAAAPSDLEVLLDALLLARPERSEPLLGRPLALARLRGQKARVSLLDAEGGTLTTAQVSELLGISRQAIHKRRRADRLLALPVGGRRFAYPAWQFADGDTLPGVGEVLRELADHDPWMKARFFLNLNPRLDGSRPLDALRSGHLNEALEAARAYGEHGAA